jgi:DNA mismatch repair protein MutS2
MTSALEFERVLEQVAQYSQFSLGRAQLMNLKPSSKRLWVEREHQRLSDAIEFTRRQGSLAMPGVHDLSLPLVALSKGMTLAIEELVHMAQLIRGTHTVKKSANLHTFQHSDLQDLFDHLNLHDAMAQSIEQAFSLDYAVYDHASSTLKRIRQQLRSALSERERIAQQFIQANVAKLSEPIATLRQDRVVVLAKQSDKHSLGGLIHGTSASGLSAYVEPPQLLSINNTIQDYTEAEQREIARICQELSDLLRPEGEAFKANLATLAELDSLFARAAYAVANDAIPGSLSQRGFVFNDARHPLIDPKHVVANSYRLEPPHNALLITGPNTGGKTVSLKLIGLFAACVASGVPVLASEARCELYDAIYVDIGDQQSIAQSLSTFSAHISNLADITSRATANSLVLLDELGGSTDPQEGESLAMAILDDLRLTQATLVATTHYSKLKAYARQHDDIQLASVQFDVDAMQPTFRYMEGFAGQSYALEIAARYRLKPSILEAAQRYKAEFKTQQETLQERLDALALQLQAKTHALEAQAHELAQEKRRLDQREASFDKTLEHKKQAHERALATLYEAAEEEAQAILTTMRTQAKNAPEHQVLQTKAQLKTAPIPKSSSLTMADLKVNQAVRLNATQQIGQVVELRKKVAIVLMNGVRMEVPPHQLSLAQATPIKSQVSIVAETPSSLSLELNLIGLRVEEALEELDQYLDQCLRARLPMARIVHGHGTGALRTAVHQRLSTQTGVTSYRLGAQGEGSTGVTIVMFGA